MFKKILIANRGEIACRVIRTAKKLGIPSVAIYSEADVESLHVRLADEAICIGPAPATESYLSAEKILAAAKQTGADAIHPGYGFMSENASFAEACAAAGVTFIGPTPQQMRDFGLKHTARALAQQAHLPLLPGTGLLEDVQAALAAALEIGYPVMLKSTAGGGGIGMRLCRTAEELEAAYTSVLHLSQNNFKNSGIYCEKFVEQARHVEVQIFGDGKGKVISLGERDCSVQRRNQKVIEETPAPGLSAATRAELAESAVRLGQSIAYLSAGTVEYVFDADTEKFYFLEVNTRLQVEHGITEKVFGVDLVEWMIRIAAGEMTLPDQNQLSSHGHAMQLRVYAEDPVKNFQPSSGLLTEVVFVEGLRVDTWIERGITVSSYYDPLLAKLIVKSDTRQASIQHLIHSLADSRIDGIETNLDYLAKILRHTPFEAGQPTTQMLAAMPYQPHTIEVLESGIQTTVQDYPGRLGLWNVGIPPSGPMDSYAHRIANFLLGNDEEAATLEMTLQGASLRFNTDCLIAIAGADMEATVINASGKKSLANWCAHTIQAGDTLRFSGVEGAGVRTYLAFSGGLNIAKYLNSRATFTLGQFGGHGGRALRVGDTLHLFEPDQHAVSINKKLPVLQSSSLPTYEHHWHIAVHYGPHGAPDFFTDEDIQIFFSTDWQVHFNSSRTGVRLIGPKPNWARRDGGEAGLHPSNIHDNAYAIGSIDFTGDMPVILGPDGPSLGGFVCPAVIVSADAWKMGQLKPGDTVRFNRVSVDEAAALRQECESVFKHQPTPLTIITSGSASALKQAAVISHAQLADGTEIVFRRAGDDYLLIEFGALILDMQLRCRVHALMIAIQESHLQGLIDLTPGIRSLQLHFDHQIISSHALIKKLEKILSSLGSVDEMILPSRTVHLPLAWNDSQTQLAIQKYQTTVRPDAPWCPSNIEFIRRINGLQSERDVYDIVFNASYMVLGLGDVYLGAPVATPIDPRHRLVTTKYNPARTWTPENAVGIGGAYMCVYGMEGPGGYQFVGRTVQMWNRFRQTASFRDEHPWLLRFFDQIKFYEVSEEQLLDHRRDFPLGRFEIKIEEGSFSLSEYQKFLRTEESSINAFKQTQQAAFDAERERWRASGQAEYVSEDTAAVSTVVSDLPDGCRYVSAVVPGSVWKITTPNGSHVEENETLAILESMKMEIPVATKFSGELVEWLVTEGSSVLPGQHIAIIREKKHA